MTLFLAACTSDKAVNVIGGLAIAFKGCRCLPQRALVKSCTPAAAAWSTYSCSAKKAAFASNCLLLRLLCGMPHGSWSHANVGFLEYGGDGGSPTGGMGVCRRGVCTGGHARVAVAGKIWGLGYAWVGKPAEATAECSC